jgi:hypothetical protein
MFGFVLGALTGGLAMWYWGDRIREFAEDNMIGARRSTADALRQLADATGNVPDRTTQPIRSAHTGTSSTGPSASPR